MNNKLGSFSKLKENHRYTFSNKKSLTEEIVWDKNTKYVDLGEFKTFFQCFITKTIKEHEANSKLYTILVSYASLNKKKITKETLLKIAEICNDRINGEKKDSETLLKYVDKAFEDRHTFKPKDNSSVRYVKNPIIEFDIVDMKTEVLALRKKADYKLMIKLAQNWDFEKDGAPSQERLGDKMGYSRRTIIRKFKDKEGLREFFEIWDELKQDYKTRLFKEEVKEVEKVKLNLKKKDVKQSKKKLKNNKIVRLKTTTKIVKLKDKIFSFNSKFKLCQLE